MNAPLWPYDLLNWPLDALAVWRRMFDAADAGGRDGPQWATPGETALELAGLKLRDYADGASGPPLVVVTPFALHDAQLADLAPGHSLVGALRRNGCARLYLIEWKSATPATRLDTIDSQLAALNVAIEDVGPPADVIGLCQGGWLSLVYAARFPAKIRRLVLAGAPVDVKAGVSALSKPVDAISDVALDYMIADGGGLVRGDKMARLWPKEADEATRLVESLQIAAPGASKEAVEAFRRWDKRALDLPGPYYQEVVQFLYRENRLATNAFRALGRRIDLQNLKHPLYVLAGETDPIAPPAQAFAVSRLVGGPVETALAPCGHLALFMGRDTLRTAWPKIAQWLRG